jgi:hypothetical protein
LNRLRGSFLYSITIVEACPEKSGAAFKLRRFTVLFCGKLILAYAAQGAFKIVGNIFPLGAGCDATLGVALCLVIFPTANVAYIFHSHVLLIEWN